MRGSLAEDAPYADAVVHGDGLTSLQSRREKGGLTEQIVSAAKGADFLQLERRGNRYTMSAARFGEPLRFDGDANEEDAEIEKKVDVVKDAIRGLVAEGLAARKGWFA